VYAGDLAGNLWRFDISTAADAWLVAKTSSTAGARPITSRPELARIRDTAGNYHRVVYVGTGRYLGAIDVSGSSTPETTQQIMAAVKDDNTSASTSTAVLLDGSTMKEQTLNTAVTPRTIPNPQPVDWSSKSGWFVKIPLVERITIDPRLQLGTIAFVANKPVDDYCALGGSSWLYALDYKTGGPVSASTNTSVGTLVSSTNVATGLTVVRLGGYGGGGVGGGQDSHLIAIINTSSGTETKELPKQNPGAGTVRRVGYREIN
jgi:type IV pilus assembly protein PilY1